MSNKITIKRSSVPGKVPAAGDLDYGEIAINYSDGNLFFKDSSNTVTTIASTQFVSVTGNVTGDYFIGDGSQLTSVPVEGNLSGNLEGNGYGANAFSFLSATGNVVATNIFATGIFYGDGSGLTGISTTGGYFNSTLTSFPRGDYGNGEPYVQQGTTEDPFGVTIVPNFTCMDPQGSVPPAADLGVLT